MSNLETGKNRPQNLEKFLEQGGIATLAPFEDEIGNLTETGFIIQKYYNLLQLVSALGKEAVHDLRSIVVVELNQLPESHDADPIQIVMMKEKNVSSQMKTSFIAIHHESKNVERFHGCSLMFMTTPKATSSMLGSLAQEAVKFAHDSGAHVEKHTSVDNALRSWLMIGGNWQDAPCSQIATGLLISKNGLWPNNIPVNLSELPSLPIIKNITQGIYLGESFPQ